MRYISFHAIDRVLTRIHTGYRTRGPPRHTLRRSANSRSESAPMPAPSARTREGRFGGRDGAGRACPSPCVHEARKSTFDTSIEIERAAISIAASSPRRTRRARYVGRFSSDRRDLGSSQLFLLRTPSINRTAISPHTSRLSLRALRVHPTRSLSSVCLHGARAHPIHITPPATCQPRVGAGTCT